MLRLAKFAGHLLGQGAIAWALLLLSVVCPACYAIGTRPNVILILADDLGWTDLACYGSDLHQTPHLDALARDGMRFTQNYSACTVCSPTRAALLTGKYPARLHITDWIPGAMPDNPKLLVPEWTKYLPLEEHTLAEAFRAAGYQTASIGKWHLGGEAYYPEQHGFQLNLAGTDKAQPGSYFAPWKIPTLSEGMPSEYLTERLGAEAVRTIERFAQQPFFLYLPHFAVHTPIQARKPLVAKYRELLHSNQIHKNPAYAAMLESLDQTVGALRDKLRELKIEDNTIIIFTSDNGGRIPTTSNQPLRYGKASAYEGGVRVPLIMFCPGVTQPGSESAVPTITMDLNVTISALAQLPYPANSVRDGVDLTPVLRQQGTLAARDLFWHYPHHQHYQLGGAMPYGAIRSGDWKLIEFFNDQHVELYNLRDDLAETHDRATDQPQLVERLRDRLHAWRTAVGAQMPSPNPQYDAGKPEYNPAKKG